MLPRHPVDDSDNGVGGDFVLTRQFTYLDTLCACVTNVLHISLGQSRTPVPLSPRHAALLRRIGHVVFVGAEEQVLRVTTASIVAAVQHILSWRNRAVRLLIHVPMDTDTSTFPRDQAIPIGADEAAPIPAAVGHVLNPLLNLCLCVLCLEDVPAQFRAVESSPRRALQPRWKCSEGCATALTQYGHGAV